MTRLRLGVLAAVFVVLGTAAGGIFDRFVWVLAVVPVLPIGLVALTVARRGVVRIGAAIVGILAATAVAVVVAGGDAGDIVTAFTSGVRRLLSTEWPSPYRPPLVGVVAAGLAVGASLSALTACARRWNLLPLVPVALTYVAVIALSAPLGIQPWALVAICVLSVAFAVLHDEGRGLHDRWLFLRGERRLLVLVALAALIAGAVSVPVTFAARADPRQDVPPTDTAALLDPIQATVALRSLEPPRAAARGDPHRRLDGRRRADADAVANGRARRVRRTALESHAHDPTDRPHAGPGDRPHLRCRRQLPARLPDARAAARQPGVGGRRRRDRPGSHGRPARRAPRTRRGGGDRVERRLPTRRASPRRTWPCAKSTRTSPA